MLYRVHLAMYTIINKNIFLYNIKKYHIPGRVSS